jgi:folate-dependent phosphoribosylglycinamide formyltransferase PurN
MWQPAMMLRQLDAGAGSRPPPGPGRCVALDGLVPAFVILTTADLPEAYFLAAFLELRAQPFAMINIVARPLASQLRVLARLRRNRGTVYLTDLLLARAADLMRLRRRRRETRGCTAFPEVDARFMEHVRLRHPRLDCRDPHADHVIDFIRAFGPDYMLLAGSPVLRPSVFGLARQAALNRHLGLVPDFRGSDCTVWALALDRPECVGYSIHVVSERVDGGDVILRRPVPLQDDGSLAGYLGRLQREASNGFVEVIDELIGGFSRPRMSQNGHGAYFPPAGWSTRRQAQRAFARLVDRHPRDPSLRPLAS